MPARRKVSKNTADAFKGKEIQKNKYDTSNKTRNIHDTLYILPACGKKTSV
jgi:hypothetical protein